LTSLPNHWHHWPLCRIIDIIDLFAESLTSLTSLPNHWHHWHLICCHLFAESLTSLPSSVRNTQWFGDVKSGVLHHSVLHHTAEAHYCITLPQHSWCQCARCDSHHPDVRSGVFAESLSISHTRWFWPWWQCARWWQCEH